MRPALEDGLLQFDGGGILRGIKFIEAGQAVVEVVGKSIIDDALVVGIETGEGFEGDSEYAVIVMPADALGGSPCHGGLADAAKPMQDHKVGGTRGEQGIQDRADLF